MTPPDAKSIRVLLVMALVLLVLASNVALACPNCKDALSAQKYHPNLAQGYFWSILFMLSMPFLILSGLGGYFYYLVRKAQAAQTGVSAEAVAAAHPAELLAELPGPCRVPVEV